MNIQTIIVIAIIIAAALYAGSLVAKRVLSFSPKKGCGTDCGCNGASKNYPHSLDSKPRFLTMG
ncbi:MAG: FeoB-associated Cys-rich membrane protein, partial [Acidobacteria bacterium]|nr:FeoB-associated Cys-rich membrane protein [Acidobacteriota bacterium]